jgi:RES domain-containing protein
VAGAVVWRIAQRRHALDRAGIGARDNGGRWNRPGIAVIYAGRTVGIAALERFVHLAGVVPRDLILVRIELPENCSVEEPALADLPAGWNAVPIRPASMDFGTAWAQERRSLVLYVPSALVPEEGNAVLNPHHPEFAAVELSIQREFQYDPRMYGSSRLTRPSESRTASLGSPPGRGGGSFHRAPNR